MHYHSIGDIDEKDKKINNLLIKLSDKDLQDLQIDDVCTEFIEIYSNSYRHKYSKLYEIAMKIFDSSDLDVQILINNMTNVVLQLELLEQHATDNTNKKKYTDTISSINKLYDHLSLEFSRIENQHSIFNRIDSYNEDIQRMKEELFYARKELNEASDRLSNVQSEFIGVLSIFSAIVLGFNGGFSLIASAFSNVTQTPIFKLSFILLISGLIVGNLFFIMLYIVSKLTGKNIFSMKQFSSGKQLTWFGKVRINLPYIFYFNVLLLVLISINTIIIMILRLY